MSLEDEKLGEQLSAYLDGELSGKDAGRIEQALQADPKLAQQLESLRRLREAVRGLPREPAPAGMAQRVLARAERDLLLNESPAAGGRGGRWWVGRLAAAAVVLVAVGVGALVFHELGQPPSETEVAIRPEAAGPDRSGHFDRKGAEIKDQADARGGGVELALRLPESADTRAKMMEQAPVLFYPINATLVQMPQVQDKVEQVLVSNGYQDQVVSQDEPSPARAIRSRGAFYNQRQAGRKWVIEVAITRGQLRKILDDLNEIRGEQNVAQIPLRELDHGDLLRESRLELAGAALSRRAKASTAKGPSGERDKLGKGEGPGVAGEARSAVQESGYDNKTKLPSAGDEMPPPPTEAPPADTESATAPAGRPTLADARINGGALGAQTTTAEASRPGPPPAAPATAPVAKPAEQQQAPTLAAADVVELRIILNAIIEEPSTSNAAEPAKRE